MLDRGYLYMFIVHDCVYAHKMPYCKSWWWNDSWLFHVCQGSGFHNVSAHEWWETNLQISFCHSHKKTQWAIEVNTSVISHNEKDPACDCTPHMQSFVLSRSLYESNGMAMPSF